MVEPYPVLTGFLTRCGAQNERQQRFAGREVRNVKPVALLNLIQKEVLAF